MIAPWMTPAFVAMLVGIGLGFGAYGINRAVRSRGSEAIRTSFILLFGIAMIILYAILNVSFLHMASAVLAGIIMGMIIVLLSIHLSQLDRTEETVGIRRIFAFASPRGVVAHVFFITILVCAVVLVSTRLNNSLGVTATQAMITR